MQYRTAQQPCTHTLLLACPINSSEHVLPVLLGLNLAQVHQPGHYHIFILFCKLTKMISSLCWFCRSWGKSLYKSKSTHSRYISISLPSIIQGLFLHSSQTPQIRCTQQAILVFIYLFCTELSLKVLYRGMATECH